MTEAIDLEQKLDDLARAMLDAAMQDGVKLSDRLEVFKICSQHHVNVSKVKSRGGEARDPNTHTMESLRNSVANGAASAPEQGDTDEPTDSDQQ